MCSVCSTTFVVCVTLVDYQRQSPLFFEVVENSYDTIERDSARLHQKNHNASFFVKFRMRCNAVHFQTGHPSEM